MLIVVNKQASRPYIAGIFKKRTTLDEFYAKVPPELGSPFVAEEGHFNTFPFYIYENRKEGFKYIKSKNQMLEYVKDKLEDSVKNKKGINFTIYTIEEDYWPIGMEGLDQMGRLNHSHHGICGNCFDQVPELPKVIDLPSCRCDNPTW